MGGCNICTNFYLQCKTLPKVVDCDGKYLLQFDNGRTCPVWTKKFYHMKNIFIKDPSNFFWFIECYLIHLSGIKSSLEYFVDKFKNGKTLFDCQFHVIGKEGLPLLNSRVHMGGGWWKCKMEWEGDFKAVRFEKQITGLREINEKKKKPSPLAPPPSPVMEEEEDSLSDVTESGEEMDVDSEEEMLTKGNRKKKRRNCFVLSEASCDDDDSSDEDIREHSSDWSECEGEEIINDSPSFHRSVDQDILKKMESVTCSDPRKIAKKIGKRPLQSATNFNRVEKGKGIAVKKIKMDKSEVMKKKSVRFKADDGKIEFSRIVSDEQQHWPIFSILLLALSGNMRSTKSKLKEYYPCYSNILTSLSSKKDVSLADLKEYWEQFKKVMTVKWGNQKQQLNEEKTFNELNQKENKSCVVHLELIPVADVKPHQPETVDKIDNLGFNLHFDDPNVEVENAVETLVEMGTMQAEEDKKKEKTPHQVEYTVVPKGMIWVERLPNFRRFLIPPTKLEELQIYFFNSFVSSSYGDHKGLCETVKGEETDYLELKYPHNEYQYIMMVNAGTDRFQVTAEFWE